MLYNSLPIKPRMIPFRFICFYALAVMNKPSVRLIHKDLLWAYTFTYLGKYSKCILAAFFSVGVCGPLINLQDSVLSATMTANEFSAITTCIFQKLYHHFKQIQCSAEQLTDSLKCM